MVLPTKPDRSRNKNDSESKLLSESNAKVLEAPNAAGDKDHVTSRISC
jgi:hypothetical protein